MMSFVGRKGLGAAACVLFAWIASAHAAAPVTI